MTRKYLLIIVVSALMVLYLSSCEEKASFFAGSFTETGEKGLSLFSFDTQTGVPELVSQIDAGPNPSFFCINEEAGLLYVINEVAEFNGREGGGLTTIRFDKTTVTCEVVDSMTVPYGGPCHISLSDEKDYLFVANYSSGSVAVIKLDANNIPETVTDSIRYVTVLPEMSHAHMIGHDPSDNKVYVTDLGLDRIMIYDFDRKVGKLKDAKDGMVIFPPGTGPRHFVFNGDGSVLYVINEIASTISVIKVGQDKPADIIQTISTISSDFKGENSCAEIMMGKGGVYLYASNRGENSIAVFRISEDGTLVSVANVPCGGNWPRHFSTDPGGRFFLVGNQLSGYISVFKINMDTGLPTGPVNSTDKQGVACLVFLKD